MLSRQVGVGWWFLPGGHVEDGESIEDALVREIAEELGVVATVGRFLGVVEHRYHDGAAHHELNLVFEVVVDGDVRSREDHLEFEWVGPAGVDVRPAAVGELLLGGRDQWYPSRDR